jgi:hypothetical protein
MKILTTFGYILEHGDWERFCELKGYDLWIINEGLADENEEVQLTFEEAQQVGLSIVMKII